MTAFLLLWFHTVCILSVWTRVSCGNTKFDLDDKYFPAPDSGPTQLVLTSRPEQFVSRSIIRPNQLFVKR
ncbi:hypothetical protein JOB18_013399 [Solea senegalensis]|uniref:Secreted protein n=1 Tax=Solea senegalensis TaxID=28829 RepID=A0AAV6RDS1_SOLSE|nr:hypothetical protein JOB18_013399 [Solea senegalensis]